MASIDDLSVKVSAQTADFSAGMNVAERGLSSVRSDALQTAGAMQVLQGRMDEAADEATTAGAKAGASSGGFLSAASGAATAEVSFGSLSVMTVGTLIPSLLALSTVIAPLTAGLLGFVTVAGAIGGIGLVGTIGAIATNGEMLKETFTELVSTIKSEFAPVFDLFAVTLDMLMQDLAAIIPELVPAQTVIERMVAQFDLLGVAIIEALPAFMDLAVTLTQQFLPPFARWVDDILPQVPGLLQGLIPTMLSVGQALGPMVDAFVEIAPTMTEFGMTVLNIITPALTKFLEIWDRAMVAINGMDSETGKLVTTLTILGPVIATVATSLSGLSAPLIAGIAAMGVFVSAWTRGWDKTKQNISSGVSIINNALGEIWQWLQANGPRIIDKWISLSQTMMRDAAAWIQANGPRLAGKAFELVGLAIRKSALEIYNIVFGKGDSILKSVFLDLASWAINNGPGILKRAAITAFNGIMAAARGLYNGLIGNSLFPDMFADIASWMTNKAPKMLVNGAITGIAALMAVYQSGFNRIRNIIANIWNGISSDIVAGMNAVISRINAAIQTAKDANLPGSGQLGTFDTIESGSMNLSANQTTDVGQLTQQNEQQIRVVLDERTDIVEGRIKDGANQVVEERERRTQRNTGRNASPR